MINSINNETVEPRPLFCNCCSEDELMVIVGVIFEAISLTFTAYNAYNGNLQDRGSVLLSMLFPCAFAVMIIAGIVGIVKKDGMQKTLHQLSDNV